MHLDGTALSHIASQAVRLAWAQNAQIRTGSPYDEALAALSKLTSWKFFPELVRLGLDCMDETVYMAAEWNQDIEFIDLLRLWLKTCDGEEA